MLSSADSDYAADPVGYCRSNRGYYKCPYTDLNGNYHPPPPAPGPKPSLFSTSRTGSALSDDYYIKRRLAELDYLIAQAKSPDVLFPSKRYIRTLEAEQKRLWKKLSQYNKKHGLLSGLNDLADGPALIDAATKGIVNVVQAVKPQPKPAPQPWTPGPQAMEWGTIALYAGAVIGGVYLFKKLGKKR